ncbi:type I-E CRISPR-associated protein Cse2/CasB [Derxia lacustris]|uniref:type I-E CRISPR-associated protein Cse2/CasB n=1 Tax=Derxia lacustris TaxID=764842 RepID=UPI000A16F1F5|nr:type I-E CRISPR-associated protein Cse2/CasB [Derxia lacustris]
MSRPAKLLRGDGPGKVLFDWWTRLASPEVSGGLRADRAALRRAGSLTAVALAPGFQRVLHSMEAAREDGEAWFAADRDRLAAAVGLLAHVGTSVDDLTLPKAASRRADGADRNPVSDLRFARLLEAPDLDALFVGLRRALPLLGDTVDVMSLANDIYNWNEQTQKRWAYQYDWKPSGE